MTSPIIQRDIVTACNIEITKAIIKELNGDYFAMLVDESFDTSRKEKMDIVLRYVGRMRFMMEQRIDVLHIQNTNASSLNSAIVNLLAQHSLSLSYMHGQCYDGAINIQGDINGLKILIKRDSRSAHPIHYFLINFNLPLLRF
ncbi:uncharacterized protein [Nicotiana tomentosiformis]|uniref:uncharacterized protein n=1 Tax=Nicotiana tomentosiformis TaxID=4098 RepID=UPI00388C8716